MKLCPVPMLVFGYWIMGNRQLFLNNVSPKHSLSHNPDPRHYFFPEAHYTAELMILFMTVFFVAIKLYFGVIKPKLGIKSPGDEDFDVDEGLDPYWNCLSGSD